MDKATREAFRTGRTLAQYSQDLGDIAAQQRGSPGDRSITHRLDSIEGELGDVKRLSWVLARVQGIDPDAE
ncbi:hypothetical protein [Streptomyces sp. NPDC055140]